MPGLLAADASSLYARNLLTFLQMMLGKDGFTINLDDDLLAATLVTHDGVQRFGVVGLGVNSLQIFHHQPDHLRFGRVCRLPRGMECHPGPELPADGP